MQKTYPKYTTIDWKRTLLMLIPPVLKKRKHALWLQALLKPLSETYEDTLYKMQHNGQVIYMEKVLNELFNKRRNYERYPFTSQKAQNGLIFIDDADRPAVQYLYTNDEIKAGYDPILIYTNNPDDNQKEFNYFLYLSSDLDLSSTEYFNFRINIPSDILESKNAILNEIKSLSTTSVQTPIKDKMLQNVDKKLSFEPGHLYTNHPNAVKITTPRFHKVVNFYKLVAKSYETRKYEYSNLSNAPSVKNKE
ncbi:hypothetical protein J8281_15000 [Aquimarina sp. U1-2]|uniref:hypothetical protein n=1 Tax=Aquimarina sp. U1-2 TaxID=2823141 RepID=UPI001AECD8B8|nr:hypothetical protein [Aquimarina sp. U1-2]MBP2833501.1 hypothetical protein [Aquimarina sp. U1-2]